MTDRIDLGEIRLDGGYFLRRDGRTAPFAPLPDEGDYGHLVTYRNSPPTIRAALLDLVRTARRKVFVASWFIGDAELTQALIEAADRLRGGVYVISAIDSGSLRRGLKGLEEADNRDAAEHKRFDELCKAGIRVRGHENCHAKFAVADDEVAVVTSANFVTRAFKVTGESGVVVRDPRQAERLGRLFARLWHERCTWELPLVPRDGLYTAGGHTPRKWPGKVVQPGLEPGVIWTDDDEHHIRRHLHDIIGGAREDLLLATWNLNASGDPGLLLDPVRAAAERGTRVRILVRAFPDRATHRAEATALVEAGAEVYADTETHVKGAFADTDKGALFSANFDAEHGMTSGVEVGCRLDGSPALAIARRFLDHMMTGADTDFVVDPRQRDLHDRMDRRCHWHLVWPLAREIEVAADDHDWREFTLQSARGPVLYVGGAPRIDLLTNGGRWSLVPGERYTLSRSQKPAVDPHRQLESWFGRKGEGPHGICPAVLVRGTVGGLR
ncbi:phospholipase D-like domain-containing protein [Herbidospora sp. RD11066]